MRTCGCSRRSRRHENASWSASASGRNSWRSGNSGCEERKRLEEEWSRHAERQGFSGHDKSLIVHIHLALREAKASWDDIKRRFRELEPPYIGRVMDPHTGRATRERIYAQQGGRCLYCGRELLPLEVHRQRSMTRATTMSCEEAKAGGYKVWTRETDAYGHLTGMVTVFRTLEDDSAVPELDHKVPVSRGGGHTLDNLCYACRECNQTKSIRTAEEFARYPHDPISGVGIALGWVHTGLEFEARGYDGFSKRKPNGSGATSNLRETDDRRDARDVDGTVEKTEE